MRTMLAVPGQRKIVPIPGFIEVFMWLQAAGAAMRFTDNPLLALGYAAGFSAGTFVGITIEQKLAFGWASVRVIATRGSGVIAGTLRAQGVGVTEFDAAGRNGAAEVLLVACRRRQLRHLLGEVRAWDEDAFVTVEEPKAIYHGILTDARRPRLVVEPAGTPVAGPRPMAATA